jgi:hypothetical protein
MGPGRRRLVPSIFILDLSMIELAGHFSFGINGTVRPFLAEGWSVLEPDFTWTEGTRSRVRLPLAEQPGMLVLEISVSPMLMPPLLRRQRLVVIANGTPVADEMVGGECPLGIEIPEAFVQGTGLLDLELYCPDAVVPVEIGANPDERRLGFAVREILLFRTTAGQAFTRRARPPFPDAGDGLAQNVFGLTGLTIPALAGCFESLGHNCEFGLAQRAMGLEALGLLRFGGISHQKLVEALDLEFDGIDAPGNLVTYINDERDGGEFMVRDRRYGTDFHSELTQTETTSEAVLAIFYRNLAFLRRKLVEDLREGGKIFVFQHPEARSVAHVRPILNLLRSHGPNTLLFVTDGPGVPSGAVEQLDVDLFHGHVARLAPTNDVKKLDVPPWVQVCANTYRLWRETGRGG